MGAFLRCRKNNFSGIYGGGMVSHILRYNFASFMLFEIIKKKEHRFERCFSLERCFFVPLFWMLQRLLHRYGMVVINELRYHALYGGDDKFSFDRFSLNEIPTIVEFFCNCPQLTTNKYLIADWVLDLDCDELLYMFLKNYFTSANEGLGDQAGYSDLV